MPQSLERVTDVKALLEMVLQRSADSNVNFEIDGKNYQLDVSREEIASFKDGGSQIEETNEEN